MSRFFHVKINMSFFRASTRVTDQMMVNCASEAFDEEILSRGRLEVEKKMILWRPEARFLSSFDTIIVAHSVLMPMVPT